MNQDDLQEIYLQFLEQDIITLLAQRRNLSLREATEVYYRSLLSRQIEQGLYGIEFLAPAVLVEDLIENELERSDSKL